MDILAWVTHAIPGDAFTYYRGDLACARARREEHLEAASVAYSLYRRGLVELVQKRHGDADYEYIAQRRKEVLTLST